MDESCETRNRRRWSAKSILNYLYRDDRRFLVALGLAVAKSFIVMVPQIAIWGMIGSLVVKYVQIPIELPHVPLIFSIIVPMNGKMAWSLYFMTVPFIVVLSIIGFESLLRAIDDRYVNVVISIVLFLLFLSPLRHVIVTAPATSIYFNEFAGGVTSSYTKYSLDLNTHIPKIASKWLINHIQHDDADYVGAVKENMMGIIKENEKKKGKGWFARFFS